MRLLQGWLIKKCALDGGCIGLCPKLRQQDWKHISDYTLATEVRVMIFCTAVSKRMRAGCITTTWNQKACHLNIVTPLPRERKNPRFSLLLKNACSEFSGTTEASYPLKVSLV
jgi:hypothetical protein